MSRIATWSAEVRWFDRLGSCRCGKAATGVLRGPGNASYGNACESCAKRALAQADKARGR